MKNVEGEKSILPHGEISKAQKQEASNQYWKNNGFHTFRSFAKSHFQYLDYFSSQIYHDQVRKKK